ncbi:type II secretion system protein M [Marinobacter salinisoli]|uniref:Type II secretion system protein M n=1 Tax=Marinobacter salinisoli TaxID=2769486 RepID=A0ABX7MNU1_9GAMM|nr:type II secretion system protein M [Marinobacter salinisoli]QSP93951.1 type II secretion system protein M [Marinobacter salinisoli]
MLGKIKEQPAVGKLIAQYDQMPRRDQQALMVLSIAIVLGVLYFLVWQPASDFHDRAVANHENSADLLAWMKANEATIKRLGGSDGEQGEGAVAVADGRALMALVTGSAREAGLSLQRFEPSGQNSIRVWLEDAPFAEVAAWLERLNTGHAVIVDQAAMDRSDEPGRVSVRLTLTI